MHLLEFMVHVGICCLKLLALLWPCVLLLFSGPFHVRFLHELYLALRSCKSSHVLEVVQLSWQTVCEGHCHEVVADQPSDGFVVVTGSYVHVWRHSWLASLFEIHGGHILVCALQPMCCRRGPIGHVSTV